MGLDATILVFWMLNFKSTFSLSSFTLIKTLFSSSSLSALRVVSSAYLRLLLFLPSILIPACDSSNPAFLIMYSAYVAQLIKNLPAMQDWTQVSGLDPWVGRSPGEGKGYPLQYSGLEYSMDYIVHGITKSWRRLSNFHFHSAYKLEKHNDNTQPCYIAFPIFNQSVVPCLILTGASWPTYQASQETGKVVLYFPQFVVIHTVKGFSIVSEAEIDVFLDFPCFFYDPANVGNLTSGSSAFPKPNLCI